VARATKPPRKERFQPEAPRAEGRPHGKPFRKTAYEDRPPHPATASPGQRADKPRFEPDARPPAPYRKAKSRFEPAASGGGSTPRFKGPGGPKQHAQTGFQHRKGGKGKPKG
jgi:hypothetical protein